MFEVPLRDGGVVATSIEQVAAEIVPTNNVDGAAVAIGAEHATQLLPRLGEAAEVFVQTCSRCGLVANVGTGTNVAVIRFAGAGTREATAAVFPCSR